MPKLWQMCCDECGCQVVAEDADGARQRAKAHCPYIRFDVEPEDKDDDYYDDRLHHSEITAIDGYRIVLVKEGAE